MKKLTILAAAAIALLATSCQQQVKPDLKTNIDTLAYEVGIMQTDGLKQYMQYQLGVDSTQLDQFIKGMQEGAMNESDPKQDAYLKGIQVGKQVQQMSKGLTREVYGEDSTKTISPKNILAGLIASLKGETVETPEQASQKVQQMMEPIHRENMLKQFGENKTAGEKYLADNAKKEGVQVLPSGVQYKVLKAGSGPLPSDTARVEMMYEGRLINGTVFDSSYDRKSPMTVDLRHPNVIKGWTEAIKQMPVGAIWEVAIPQELGYGDQNMGQIKPFSTLIFKMERLK